MKKFTRFICTALLPTFLVAVSAYSQEDMVVLNSDAFENPRRPQAVFRHEAHNELAQIEECNVCHHVYDDNNRLVEDESSEDQRCSDCHQLVASGRKPPLMKAFHLNCKGCHKVRKNGPTMCGQCHVKQPVRVE
jgi:hypothetical protein